MASSPTLPVWDLVKKSFLSVFGDYKEFLRLYWILMLLWIVVIGVPTVFMRPPHASDPGSLLVRMIAGLVLLAGILLIPAIFNVSWYRALLSGKKPSETVQPRMGDSEWQMVISALKLLGISFLFGLASLILVVLCGLLGGVLHIAGPLTALVVIAAIAAGVILFTRLCLIFPLTALKSSQPLKESAQLTEGKVLPLFLGFLCIALLWYLPTSIVIGILGAIFGFIPFLGIIVIGICQGVVGFIALAIQATFIAQVTAILKSKA